MTRDEARAELIRIAAILARAMLPLSSNPEDHRQKTYSLGRVCRLLATIEERERDLAFRLRRAADALRGSDR